MRKGFFTLEELNPKPVLSERANCERCGLYRKCQSPKMSVAGKGKKGILIVGEAPGETEDELGKPFVGRSGQLLQSSLAKLGVDLFRDCFVTNAAICRPQDNRTPTEEEINYCRPNVFNAINGCNPHTIILLGKTAVQSVIGWLWKDDLGEIGSWIGWRIPSPSVDAWVCPTWHPSYVLRQEKEKDGALVRMLFEKNLENALEIQGKPIHLPKPKIDCILNHEEASLKILSIHDQGNSIAFDFETDRLNPEAEGSQIVSCSISNGSETIAYPWHGYAIEATVELLRSTIPKIGWNIKFEDRWIRKNLKTRVRNWAWDGMIAAHIIDNRPNITGLKFQAFAQLGQESYDDHIKPYLKSDGRYTKNRIKEIPLDQLLKYNAFDSYLEWQIAQIQMIQMKG